MPDLHLYNTASRSKERFVPINPPKVGIYTCGPTVYSDASIGNLRAYIIQDVLFKTLTHFGLEPFRVMNITDVGHLTSDSDTGEDKMEIGAKREGLTAWDVAKKYEDIFLEDLNALNIQKPDRIVQATATITEQITFIRGLEEKGFTYVISDGVYFDTTKFPHYPDFAHLDVQGLQAGARVEFNQEKRNSTDFALWKFSENPGSRDMEWLSPWGVGYPGWHIECSAIALKELGAHFDIHAGGVDHISVHHTNEIAQTESLTGEKMANFWFHNEFLQINGGKMSKSLGNVYTISTLKEWGIEPLAYRLFTYSASYRSKLNFTREGIASAQSALIRLRILVAGLPESSGHISQVHEQAMERALADDLNMPEAIAAVWELMRSKENPADKRAFIEKYDQILSLDLTNTENSDYVPSEIMDLARKRIEARSEKDWVEADRIRDEIEAQGYIVTDLESGISVRRKLQKP